LLHRCTCYLQYERDKRAEDLRLHEPASGANRSQAGLQVSSDRIKARAKLRDDVGEEGHRYVRSYVFDPPHLVLI